MELHDSSLKDTHTFSFLLDKDLSMSIKPLTKSPWNIQISVGAATEPVKAYHTTSSQTASF